MLGKSFSSEYTFSSSFPRLWYVSFTLGTARPRLRITRQDEQASLQSHHCTGNSMLCEDALLQFCHPVSSVVFNFYLSNSCYLIGPLLNTGDTVANNSYIPCLFQRLFLPNQCSLSILSYPENSSFFRNYSKIFIFPASLQLEELAFLYAEKKVKLPILKLFLSSH